MSKIRVRDYWERDDVQFPRLLAEIKAIGLTPDQMNGLTASMDLSDDEIHELLDRAEETFDAVKMQLDMVDETCIACDRSFPVGRGSGG
jgi:cytochrome c556